MKKNLLFIISFIFACFCPICLVKAQHKVASVDELIESTTNDTVRVDVLLKLSYEYVNSANNKAFEYGVKALVLANKLRYTKGIALANNNLGDLYWYKYDFVSSELYYNEGLKLFKQLNDSTGIAEGYRNMGWIFYNKKEYLEALESHYKALEINRKLQIKHNIKENFNDIANSYSQLKLNDSALVNYAKAIAIQEELDDADGLTVTYGNIGDVYNQMNLLARAIKNYSRAVAYAKKSNNELYYLTDLYEQLSDAHKKGGDYDLAIKFNQLSTKMAQQRSDKNALQYNYKSLSELYAFQKKYGKALYYNQLSSILLDSIHNETDERLEAEMHEKYDLEKKLLAIRNLEKDKEITEQKLEQGKKVKLYLSSFGVVVACFVIFLMRSNKQREKINFALNTASEQIKHRNAEIMDSIAYSKRIQDVSLPSAELRNKLFPNSFIVFKPKEIVSGDFYWYAEKEGKRIIACCDCTGHGVPGALMSMIGINTLNRIVNGKGIMATNEILSALHNEISKTLKQDEQQYVEDSIEIAVLCFHSDTEIDYSGANSPLWIVKKGSNTVSELIEIEPNTISIGIKKTEETIAYTKHSIRLEKEDCVYMFSDGFINQFKGTQDKAASEGLLKHMLVEVSHLPVNEQHKRIEDDLRNWMATNEQVDDISMIGIKI